jgi:hypothetical protein
MTVALFTALILCLPFFSFEQSCFLNVTHTSSRMAKEKVRVQVAKYPRLPFHSIHFAQLLSAIVVTAILSYFVWQLSHDSFYVPWTYHLVRSYCSPV